MFQTSRSLCDRLQGMDGRMKNVVCLLLGVALFGPPGVLAQNAAQSKDPNDGAVVGAPDQVSPADKVNRAWSALTGSLGAKREDTRIEAINALSLLGGDPKAEDLVRSLMHDAQADIDVRLAAIVATGQMDKDRGPHPSFAKDLHDLLGSEDPKLSFTAATTLWALKDTSGEDVLAATAEGERASDYSFLKRSEHNASRTLHSPEALAKIAMMQGLTILVPPVGMGMGAYGYLKGTPGASPQVTAIEQLAKVHTPEVQKVLVVATKTKDPAARIAAAESLAQFSGPDVQDALYALLDDDKLQVRLTASAAYLKVVSGHGSGEHRARREAGKANP